MFAIAIGLIIAIGGLVATAATAPDGEVAAGPGQLIVGSRGDVTGIVSEDDIVNVSGIEVHASIADDVAGLLAAAEADGIVLGGFGWRSHIRQHELRRINGCPNDGSWTHSANEDPSQWAPASACRIPTARPGFSNHESGLAIDFTYRGSSITSRSSVAFIWLANNAATFGLYNLPSEPWHWSVNGK